MISAYLFRHPHMSRDCPGTKLCWDSISRPYDHGPLLHCFVHVHLQHVAALTGRLDTGSRYDCWLSVCISTHVQGLPPLSRSSEVPSALQAGAASMCMSEWGPAAQAGTHLLSFEQPDLEQVLVVAV